MDVFEQLEQLKKAEAESVSLHPPFPFVSINYDEEIATPGTFIVGGERRGGEWVQLPTVLKYLEFVLLKERGQYTYYNQHTNRLTVKSNIFPKFQSRTAIDLITRKPIETIRNELKLTYNAYLLILLKLEGGFIPALWRLKGAVLKAWIDYSAQHRDLFFTYKINAVTEKEKKGNVKFFVPLFSEPQQLTEEEAHTVLQLIPPTAQAFEEWVFAYNNRAERWNNEEPTSSDDVEIPFE